MTGEVCSFTSINIFLALLFVAWKENIPLLFMSQKCIKEYFGDNVCNNKATTTIDELLSFFKHVYNKL